MNEWPTLPYKEEDSYMVGGADFALSIWGYRKGQHISHEWPQEIKWLSKVYSFSKYVNKLVVLCTSKKPGAVQLEGGILHFTIYKLSCNSIITLLCAAKEVCFEQITLNRY